MQGLDNHCDCKLCLAYSVTKPTCLAWYIMIKFTMFIIIHKCFQPAIKQNSKSTINSLLKLFTILMSYGQILTEAFSDMYKGPEDSRDNIWRFGRRNYTIIVC